MRTSMPTFPSLGSLVAAGPLAVVLAALLVSCATHRLPNTPPDLPESHAMSPAIEGPLADLALGVTHKHGLGASAFHLANRSTEGLNWRLMMVDLATRSLDLQYFMWNQDECGALLAERVVAAASRGVRVRLLIDDTVLLKRDSAMASADLHPNIAIRVYNPWRGRGSTISRATEFLSNMEDLNQRMHNKAFVADNHVAIVGGRNIGNEYFGLSETFNFRDFDVIAIGPCARQVSVSFDRYWNSRLTYPAAELTKRADEEIQAKTIEKGRRLIAESREKLSPFVLERSTWEERLDLLEREASPGYSRVIDDDPHQGLDVERVRLRDKLLRLRRQGATRDILMANAYFIPRQKFVDEIRRLTEAGVRIRILTNSLGSSDVAPVNSAYGAWRRPVLEAGAELYELRHDANIHDIVDAPNERAEFLSLHAKVIAVDRELSFIGSVNLSPRSLELNTEMGILIEDPVLGEKLASALERDMSPENAWKLGIDEEGEMYWESSLGRVHSQPLRYGFQSFEDWFFGLFPLEDHL